MKTNLQKLRKDAGYRSAKAFAEHIGMSVDTYTGYEQGKRKFSLEQAWIFADELQVSLDELAGREWHEGNQTFDLPPEELVLLTDYRVCAEADRRAVSRLAHNSAALRAAEKSGEGGRASAEGLLAGERRSA